jgi:hypothetical protein
MTSFNRDCKRCGARLSVIPYWMQKMLWEQERKNRKCSICETALWRKTTRSAWAG